MTLLKTESQARIFRLNLTCFSEHFPKSYYFYVKLLVLSILIVDNSHLSEGSKIHMLTVYHMSLPDPPSILSYAPAVPYGYIRVSPVSTDFGLLGVMGLLAGNLKVGTGKVRVFICLASFLVSYHMLSLGLLYTPALQVLSISLSLKPDPGEVKHIIAHPVFWLH